jgi:protocatechuate 3,4-dioxygenase beta subunit
MPLLCEDMSATKDDAMTGSRFTPTRRHVLAGGASLAILAAAGPAAALTPTPRLTRGPFYPVAFPLDSDADLVRVKGRAAQAMGEVTHLMGRVLDGDGKPVPGAVVDIWQCDARGVYMHPRDRGGRDENFQGYGRTTATANGAYRFRTIKPVPYPGRTPHIHVAVKARGFPELVSQIFVEGHPQNADDWIYRNALAQGGAASARFVPVPATIEPGALLARFDLVLPR